MRTACVIIFAAAAAVAADLPWVYDTSGRTVADVKSVSSACYDGAFDTMAGNWSYVSTTSYLRSKPWTGLMIIVH